MNAGIVTFMTLVDVTIYQRKLAIVVVQYEKTE